MKFLRSMNYHRKQALWGFLFVVPGVAVLIIFSIYPMVQALNFSFTDYDMVRSPEFIGLDNYVRILSTGPFLNSLKITFIYVFGTVVPVWFISFLLALLLSKIKFGSTVLRTLLFIPTVLPLLTITLVWKLFFNYRGVMNGLLLAVGLSPVGWLTKSAFAPLAMIITSWWHAPSYYMILFLAGIQAIPAVYHEAAEIDGANAFQRLRHVTLPLLKPTIVMVMVLSIINGFRTFGLQYVMTGGGPGSSTEIVPLLIYKTAFNFSNFGEASAMSVVYFLLLLVFSLIQLRLLRGETSGD